MSFNAHRFLQFHKITSVKTTYIYVSWSTLDNWQIIEILTVHAFLNLNWRKWGPWKKWAPINWKWSPHGDLLGFSWKPHNSPIVTQNVNYMLSVTTSAPISIKSTNFVCICTKICPQPITDLLLKGAQVTSSCIIYANWEPSFSYHTSNLDTFRQLISAPSIWWLEHLWETLSNSQNWEVASVLLFLLYLNQLFVVNDAPFQGKYKYV